MTADGKHDRHPNEIDVEEIAVAYVAKIRRELVSLGYPDFDLARLPDEFRQTFRDAFRREMRERLDWSNAEIDSALESMEGRAFEIMKGDAGSKAGQATPLH